MAQFNMDTMQGVFRCDHCNKPFDKQSTLKRHGYYCRSRKLGSIARLRSCVSCAKNKARCDKKHPDCSRCVLKNIQCHYPVRAPRSVGPGLQHSNDTLIQQDTTGYSSLAALSGAEGRSEARNDGNIHLDEALVTLDSDLSYFNRIFDEWDSLGTGFTNILDPQLHGEAETSVSLRTSAVPRTPVRSNSLIRQGYPASSPPKANIPMTPSSTPRSLIQRPRREVGAKRVSNLILQSLRSYPLMLVRHNTLPPFIHPCSVPFDAEEDYLEPLNNCISLLHMLNSGVRGSRKLFWRNVRLECERLCEEHLKLDRWKSLAAMQALSIYIIMRIEESETEHNNLDSLFVATVVAVSKHMNRRFIPQILQSAPHGYKNGKTWRDWIFEESTLRMCVIYKVLNMLVYFEPAAMCTMQSGVVIAPLPSKKQLWEASDEFTWRGEIEKEPDVHEDFGLAANGELFKVHRSKLPCFYEAARLSGLDSHISLGTLASWDEWCSGMDGLGGLVMLAASLTA